MSRSIRHDKEGHVGNGLDNFDTYQVKRAEIINNGGDHGDHLFHPPGGHIHSDYNLTPHHNHRLGKNAVPALVQAFSGAVGSSIANVAVHPLDIVVKRLQVQRQIQIQNQIRAERHLSSGIKAPSPQRHTPPAREPDVSYQPSGRPGSGVQSPEILILGMDDLDEGYERTVDRGERGGQSSSHLHSKTYTSRGGKEDIVDQLKWTESSAGYEYAEQYHSVVDCAQKIWAEEGLGGFYTGIVEETIGTLGSVFWYFAAYSYIRNKRLHKRRTQKLPVLEELLIGLVAGSVSRIFLTPFNTIVIRKQTHAMLYPNAKAPGIVQIYNDIMREKGVTGFWSGYSANIFLSLNPSITFLLYESFKNFAGGNRRRMKGAETFLIAAVAKAIATGLTYPLAVAKSRMQVAGDDDDDLDLLDITSIGRAGEEIKKNILKKKKKAGNLIEILADIFKHEGITGFYEGVMGELLRGFVSSGITMVIKESVHRTILSLYYFVMRAYNRAEDHTFRSTTKLIAKDVYEKAGPRQKKILNKAIGVAGLIEAGKEKVVGDHHSKETRHHDGVKMKAAAAAAAAGLAAGAVHSHRKNEKQDEHGMVHTARERVKEWREGVGGDSHRVGHVGHIDDRIHTGETHQNLHQSHSHSGHSGSRTDQFGRTGVTEHTHIEERIEHGRSSGSHGRRGSAVSAGVVGAAAGAIGHKLSGHSHSEHGHSHSGHGGDLVTKTTKVVEEFGIVKDPHSTHEERGRQHGIVGSVSEKIVGQGRNSHSRRRSHSGNRHGSSALELAHKTTGKHSHGHGHRDGQITHSTETVREWRDEANAVEDLRRFGVASTINEDARSDFGETLHKGHSIVGHGHTNRFGDDAVHHDDHGRTVVEKTQITRINENLYDGAHHNHSHSAHGHNTHRQGGVVGAVIGAAEKVVGHGHSNHGHTHNGSRANFGHTDGRTIVEKTEITRIDENIHDGGHHSTHGRTHNGSRANFGHTDGHTIVEKTEITRVDENIHDGRHHSTHGHTHNDSRANFGHTDGRTIVEKTEVTRVNENIHDGGHHSTHGHSDSRTNFGGSALHTDGRTVVEMTEITRTNENIHDGGHHNHGQSAHTRNDTRTGSGLHTDGRTIVEKTEITRINENIHNGGLHNSTHGHSTHRHNESRSSFGDSALHADGHIAGKTQITRINESSHDGAHHSHSTHGRPHNDSRSNFGGAALHSDGRAIVEKTETVRFGETHKGVGHQYHRGSSPNHGHNSGGKAALGLDNTRTTTTLRETSSGSGWLGEKAPGNASINTAAATAGSGGITTVTRTEEFWPGDEDARSSVYNFLDEETKEVGGVSIETRTVGEKLWDDKMGKGYS